MDHQTFDALAQRIARRSTRRAALSALLGGLLLHHAPVESDATKKAQRRKRRRRKQRRQATGAFLRPISVRIQNRGIRTITVEYGWWKIYIPNYIDCLGTTKITIPPGEDRVVRSPTHVEFLWINNYYWIDFQNAVLTRPGFRAAANGRPAFPNRPSSTCPPRGSTLVEWRSLREGETTNLTMYSRTFRVTRNRDTNYKEFTLMVPSLGAGSEDDAP